MSSYKQTLQNFRYFSVFAGDPMDLNYIAQWDIIYLDTYLK